jgi:hypothetical protein
MNTGRKFAAAFVLVAAFAGASANEAVVEEIVVVGHRAPTALETLDIARPVAPEATLESLALTIALPEIELVDFGADAQRR